MTTTFLDLKWSEAEDAAPQGDAGDAGWVRHSPPRDYPSPALLAAAGALAARGEPVAFRFLAPAEAARLEAPGRVVLAAPAVHREVARAVQRALAARGADVALFDPWAPAGERAPAAGYALARGQAACAAELDAAPPRDPVHPWVCAPAGPPAELDALVASLAAGPDSDSVSGSGSDSVSGSGSDPAALRARPIWQAEERDLYLDDPRVPLTMDRLRQLARAVKRALREGHTMLKLHLRAWPAAIDPGIVDHLTLLPVGSLDLLAGGPDEPGVAQALAALRDGGMSHLTSVSLVLARPGEAPEACVEAVKRALSLAVAARVRRVRFAFWLGEGAPCPTDPAHHHALFAASHPDWHPIEYAGVSDFVALMRQVMRGVDVVGPEFAPGWEPPRPDGDDDDDGDDGAEDGGDGDDGGGAQRVQ